ncbi:hypothetical protein T459_28390 [Capsicum annuum]|uniref:Uncharacterized protein n=1 Tax=Capsicum annuum TaxID=4072 RepID=A0A2G2YGM4_CAPAN|nr:hypothetical protein T459_28390 [Capsicum annuum]
MNGVHPMRFTSAYPHTYDFRALRSSITTFWDLLKMMGSNSLIHKLNELCSVSVFDLEISNLDPFNNSSESFIQSREVGPLCQEAQKLELLKLQVPRGNLQMLGAYELQKQGNHAAYIWFYWPSSGS